MTSVVLVALACTTFHGCGGGGMTCLPNATRGCTCPDGGESARVCLEDGSGWSDCLCGAADAGTDGDAPDTTDGVWEGECASDGDCDDSDPCTRDICDTVDGTCRHEPLDADGDGYPAASVSGVECGGSDCDDSHDGVHPGAGESSCFDGWDENCDGLTGPDLLIEDGTTGEAPACESTRIVWTGSEVGLAWTRDGTDLVFSRFGPDGAERGTPIERPIAHGAHADLTWSGSVFGMSWVSSLLAEARATVIDASGSPLVSDVRLGAAHPDTTRITWTGSEFAVLWTRHCSGEDCVTLSRIDGDGGVVGSNVEVTRKDEGGTGCGIVWTGSELAAGWYEPAGLSLLRLDSTGTLLADVPIEASAQPSTLVNPCVAWTGSALGVVWKNGADAATTRLVDPTGGTIGSDVVLSTSGSAAVSQVWTGSEMGIACGVPAGGEGIAVELTRLGPDGTLLSGPTAATSSETFSSCGPSIDWTGSSYPVCWLGDDPHAVHVNFLAMCD